MSKAILTRYFPATALRGARIRAIEPDGKRYSEPYDAGLTDMEAHFRVAREFHRRLGWPGRIVGCGWIKGGAVFTFEAPPVLVDYIGYDGQPIRDGQRVQVHATADLKSSVRTGFVMRLSMRAGGQVVHVMMDDSKLGACRFKPNLLKALQQ